MRTEDRARARLAKAAVRDALNRPSWGRGVGIGCAALLGETWMRTADPRVCVPAVYVMVQRREHVALARGLLGDSVYGVPIVIEPVGDFHALGADVPPMPAGYGPAQSLPPGWGMPVQPVPYELAPAPPRPVAPLPRETWGGQS
jgi:hypothetical protein